MTNNNIDLSRRTFYKTTDLRGQSWHLGGVAAGPGAVLLPKTQKKDYGPHDRMNGPQICTSTAVHASDTPRNALLWGVLRSHSTGLNFGDPDHPFGMRLFSFRGTPFDASINDLYNNPPKYGFTRIKIERELDPGKYIELNPATLASTSPDEETVAEQMLKNCLLIMNKVADLRNGQHPKVEKALLDLGELSQPKKSSDGTLEGRLLDSAHSSTSVLITRVYNSAFRGWWGASNQTQRAIYEKWEKAQEEGPWQVRGSRYYEIASAAVGLSYMQFMDVEVSPQVQEAIELLTSPPGRSLYVSIPDVTPNTPKFYRAMSLRQKIANLMEKEYADLDATIETARI